MMTTYGTAQLQLHCYMHGNMTRLKESRYMFISSKTPLV